MDNPKTTPDTAIDHEAERTTPPDASGSKKPLRRIIAEAVLEHAGLPEEQAIELRLLMAFEELTATIDNYFTRVIKPTKPGEEDRAKQLFPFRQEVLEYITLMEAGLQTFIDAHPIPEKE